MKIKMKESFFIVLGELGFTSSFLATFVMASIGSAIIGHTYPGDPADFISKCPQAMITILVTMPLVLILFRTKTKRLITNNPTLLILSLPVLLVTIIKAIVTGTAHALVFLKKI